MNTEKCPYCKLKIINEILATFWDGYRWHRACAVKYQLKQVKKYQKALCSPNITQATHSRIIAELKEAEADLKALRVIASEENEDKKEIGKIFVRRGFGARVDTHKLLVGGELTQKQISRIAEIKRLYGTKE